MDTADKRIERQLMSCSGACNSTLAGEMHLERSAYGIITKLADEGAQRLGALATAFDLDPSTITRQVQALEELGMTTRKTDSTDRRASILDLTDAGRQALERTRSYRRQRQQGPRRLAARRPQKVRPTTPRLQRLARPPTTQVTFGCMIRLLRTESAIPPRLLPAGR
jgi:DNA-binding MarR family transcriptional regulator